MRDFVDSTLVPDRYMPAPCPWQEAPFQLTLAEDEIHLWYVSLTQPIEMVQKLAATLTEDEQVRAYRFKFDYLQTHFIIARGVLRDILSRYLQLEAKHVQLTYSKFGKPSLTDHEYEFNLSHSHNLAVYAVTVGKRLGIDVEGIRQIANLENIAMRFFAPIEYRTLCNLPEEQKLVSFLNCWTRKEAFIKAVGSGLSYPLDKFSVSLIPGEPARLLHIEDEPDTIGAWSWLAFSPTEGYIAALTMNHLLSQPELQTTYYHWDY